MHCGVCFHGLTNHPAKGVQVVVKHVTYWALFGAHQFWQLANLCQTFVTDLFDLAKCSSKVLVFQTVERDVAYGILPCVAGFFGQSPHRHHVVHHGFSGFVHHRAHGPQVRVCLVLAYQLVDLSVFEVNQELGAILLVRPAHLIQTHALKNTTGNLRGAFAGVSVLGGVLVNQGVDFCGWSHAFGGVHLPQACCFLLNQRTLLEVFQQQLGVVLCLAVQAHGVELAQLVAHGPIKLLPQSVLNRGSSVSNLCAKLGRVARFSRG